MIVTIAILLLLAGGIVGIPALVLFAECVTALFARKPSAESAPFQLAPRIGVLISAHNEELLIESTVKSLLSQLRHGDAGSDVLLVVADNCTDATASLARRAGATVIERHDLSQRGKGYGLAFGMAYLKSQAVKPEVVILFDADVVIQPGVVARLAHEAARVPRPIQALYIQQAPPAAGPKGAISTLAFIVKNAVRPAGLNRLGMPCVLTGSGMAFQWNLIENAPLASGHLVEDMELGLHFLRQGAGKGPKFCPGAVIVGDLPGDTKAAYVQRTRWEHGHLGIIRGHALPLFFSGLRRLRLDMIVTALDLAVPPLALLAGLWIAGATASLTFAIVTNLWAPAMVFAASGLLIFTAVMCGWRQHARHLRAAALLSIPLYVFWKIPLYFRFLTRKQTTWVRTARTASGTDGATAV